MVIDLNCDLGEGYGIYRLGNDNEMMRIVTSVNIACGFHAGDPVVMAQTIKTAMQNGVAVGAHPGYPDRQGFGRRDLALSPEEIEAMLIYQIGALQGFCTFAGTSIRHVKLHGALYNRAMKDNSLARLVVKTIQKFNEKLIIVGQPESELLSEAKQAGMLTMAEGFPDRGYAADGSLLPRNFEGAVLRDPSAIAAHAVKMATDGLTIEGNSEPVKFDTLCLHGDHVSALENAMQVRQALEAVGIKISLK